jgi:hypothetical protein
MSTATSDQLQGRPGVIARIIEYVLGTSARRLLRDMRQREVWIRQAQTAPTVKAWTDSLER